MTFREREIARLHERMDRLDGLLKIDAPDRVIAAEGGLIIRSVINVVGPSAFAEVAAYLLGQAQRESGLCPRHGLEDDRPSAKGDPYGWCADCAKGINERLKHLEGGV